MKIPLILITIVVALLMGPLLVGQVQNTFTGSVVTGQLQLVTTTNVSQIANQVTVVTSQSGQATQEKPKNLPPMPPPPAINISHTGIAFPNQRTAQGLSVSSSAGTGFDGMTHMDQRLANNDTQFSVEPPNPSIAVSGGQVLEGVNNAVRSSERPARR